MIYAISKLLTLKGVANKVYPGTILLSYANNDIDCGQLLKQIGFSSCDVLGNGKLREKLYTLKAIKDDHVLILRRQSRSKLLIQDASTWATDIVDDLSSIASNVNVEVSKTLRQVLHNIRYTYNSAEDYQNAIAYLRSLGLTDATAEQHSGIFGQVVVDLRYLHLARTNYLIQCALTSTDVRQLQLKVIVKGIECFIQ